MGCYRGDSLSGRQNMVDGDRAGPHGDSTRRYATLVGWLATVVVICATSGASGAESAVAADAAAASKSPNQQAVAWLDHFAVEQVLFHAKDIARIRKKLLEAPAEKAQQWLDETAELRRKIDSPEWQQTRKWLGEFLKVQAIYSDKELEEFRKKAMTASPVEVAKMMQGIEQQRSTLASNATDSARRRQQTMDINKAFQQEQFAQRQAVRRAASQAPKTGTTKATGKPSYAARSASRAPLVNSLDAARLGVYRSIWPRW